MLKLILLRAPILRLLASVNNLLQFFTDQKLCNSSSERYRISLRYSHLYASLYFFSFFFFHFFLHHYTCVAAWHGRWGRDVGTLADLRSHPQAPTEHNFSPMIIFLLKLSVVINNRWSIGHDTRNNHHCHGSDLRNKYLGTDFATVVGQLSRPKKVKPEEYLQFTELS